jgi:DNA-binding NarL/FixJ family response regulator
MFLTGLASLLEHLGLDVVGQATSEDALLALAGEQIPDVVVVDGGPPAMSGAATVHKLVAVTPTARVIVLSESAEPADVAEAVVAGAGAYLLKESSVKALLTCIHAAASTRSLILPQGAAVLIRGSAVQPRAGYELSPREIEVLRLIAAGRDNGEIASALFISPATAKSHVARILEKLESENRVQAAVFAVRAGLV